MTIVFYRVFELLSGRSVRWPTAFAVQGFEFLSKLPVPVGVDTGVNGAVQEVRPHEGVVDLRLRQGQPAVQVTCQEKEQRQHVVGSGARNVSERHRQKSERFGHGFGDTTSV